MNMRPLVKIEVNTLDKEMKKFYKERNKNQIGRMWKWIKNYLRKTNEGKTGE